VKRLDRYLQRIRIAKVRPYINPGDRVLDIGCADGALRRQVPNLAGYVGVDPDASADAPWPNARFLRSAFPTPLLDAKERFNVLAAFAVLEHVPVQEHDRFAGACARHLIPGGFLVISVPSPIVDRIIDGLKRLRLIDGMREDQHYGYDPSRTPAIFEPHGFRLHRHSRFEAGLNHLFVFQRMR
jgi:SAM-dependent methyltransferase